MINMVSFGLPRDLCDALAGAIAVSVFRAKHLLELCRLVTELDAEVVVIDCQLTRDVEAAILEILGQTTPTTRILIIDNDGNDNGLLRRLLPLGIIHIKRGNALPGLKAELCRLARG